MFEIIILLLSISAISIVTSRHHRSHGVTVDDINDLRAQLREEYKIDSNLLACTVRLAFHDCSGPGNAGSTQISQCNGCVDFQNPDHNGLVQGCVEPLQQIYVGGWNDIMSRADFWAAAATIGLEYAQELDIVNIGDSLPEIPYYFGRIDCGDDAGDAHDTKHFVSAIYGWKDIYSWFHQNLGYNEQEIVAIIGAHTLGKTHSFASGFSTLGWVRNFGILDNHFYIDLQGGVDGVYSNGWEQAAAPNNSFYEWHNVQHEFPYIMLNSDMSLWYDIDDHMINTETGRVTCDYSTCGISPVREITKMYVDDNQKWLDHFSDVFEKLIQTGYTRLEPMYCGNGRGVKSEDSSDSMSDDDSSSSSSDDDDESSSDDGGDGGRRDNDGRRGSHAMSVGHHYNDDIDGHFDEESYYWRMLVMYPVLNGVILVIVVINTLIVCQIKSRGDRMEAIGIDNLKYEGISHEDPEEVSIS